MAQGIGIFHTASLIPSQWSGFKETIGLKSQRNAQKIPETADGVFTQDETKEKRGRVAVRFEVSVFKEEKLDQPAYQKREPDVIDDPSARR